MKIKKFNKKATDKIISVYWFVILFIVAGAVVYMAAVFYGEPYDVCEVEANIIVNQIADCISQGGRIEDSFIDAEGGLKLISDNFLSECHLTFNVEDFKNWKEQEQFYVEVNFYKFQKDATEGLGNSFGNKIAVGNINLKGFCDKASKYSPACVERSFYTLDNQGEKYVIKIKSIVRKTEKNV